MRRIIFLLILVVAAVLLILVDFRPRNAPAISVETSAEPALLVVSFDGFRAEYSRRNLTPNLEKLRSEGTSASHLLSIFPTVTLANHHSIATVRY